MWQPIVHVCVWISLLTLFAVDGASFPKKDNIKLDPSALTVDERQAIGTKIQTYFASGEHVNLVNYCASLEKQYGTLDFGFSNNSSPYIFLGASLYSLHRTDDALAAFKKALISSPDNGNVHVNIGEILLQTFKLDDAMASFRKAYELNNAGALPRILRTIGWSADWADLEEFVANLEAEMKNCDNEDDPSTCDSENAFGSEYTDSSLISGIVAEFRSENNKLSPLALQDHEIAPLWDVPYNATHSLPRKEPLKRKPQRLKVGLVSSDFNVHPVSQLIRGMIQFVDKERIELYCYSLQSKSSWWGDNITSHVEHFVSILEMNHRDAANLIAKHQIDILIDLNGHTMFSGLAIFKFRPAPIQLTFLGLPTSTASEYIDYYLGDFVSNPPEFRQEFLESMALLPPSYIVSDYAQLLGDIADRDFEARANRSCFFETPMGSSFATPTYSESTVHQFDDASLLLATFSNSQKLDPSIFHVWMNLLSSLPGAKMLMMEYRGADYFLRNLHRVARSFGIETDRYVMVPQKSYIDHLDCKTAVDLALDTVSKNGHTTGLDALWAGIPLLSMGGRNRALARAAESMATALEHEVGLTFSLKEYEDLALRVLKAKRASSTDKDTTTAASNPRHDSHSTQESRKRTTDYASSPLLLQWRREIIRQRRASSLFNTRLFTKYFERYMESLWEIVHLQRIHPVLHRLLASSPRHQRRQRLYPNRRHFMHVFPAKSQLPDFATQFSPLQTTTMRNTNVADPSYLHAAMNNVAVYAPNILNYTDLNVLDRCSSNKGRKPRSEYEPIPAYVFDGRNIMLNIGGIHAADGWLLVNNKVRWGSCWCRVVAHSPGWCLDTHLCVVCVCASYIMFM